MLLSRMTTPSIEDAYVLYRRDVYKFLLRRIADQTDAEELTQEVFADAASALAESEPPRSMRSWLLTIAERRLIDELRRRKRTAAVVVALDPPPTSIDEPALGTLDDAVRRLPLMERRLLLLRVLEGRTHREIAALLGCKESTSKMRLSRALQRLRDELQIVS
jgi:RNA polymerase sigma-70 factor (ECF subfamily)